jgi:signal transducing adaptor molecule
MLIAMWTEDFENDPNLGMMEECYDSLKAKSTGFTPLASFYAHFAWTDYKFEPVDEPPPRDDDEVRRREEEELQRVLELSKNETGGRRNWNEYSLASSSGAGGSGSKSSIAHPPAVPSASSSSIALASQQASQQPLRSNEHAPPPEAHAAQAVQHAPAPGAAAAESSTEFPPAQEPSSPTSTAVYVVTRVRALHTFEPTEPNELAFERGDIIKVVNREYKDWWRGQLKGRAGIFPVNYVVRFVAYLTFTVFTIPACRSLFQNLHRSSWQLKHSKKLPYSHRPPMLIDC